MKRLRACGIYDLRTYQSLINHGVKDFSFDLRPKSFNFIQEYKIIEILQKLYRTDHKISLIFENEKNFVISKIVNDIKEDIPKIKLFLEFHSLIQSKEDLTQFGCPFYFQFKNTQELMKMSQIPLFKGLIMNPNGLDHFSELSISIHKNLSLKALDVSFEFILSLGHQFNLAPSFFEYFDISVISFPLDHNLEVCYRNIDLKKMNEQLIYLRNI